MPGVLFVVSPHGFGHAARACAVIERLVELLPGLRVDVATTVPDWFFCDSLAGDVDLRLHRVRCDVGLVQRTPFEEDPAATAELLDRVVGPRAEGLERLAESLGHLRPAAVVADVAPLGLALGRRLGAPSVLVENFTWDFIYRSYGPPLDAWAPLLERLTAAADLRIQAAPFCELAPGALQVAPVARRRRSTRESTRRRLGIADDRPMVLVSTGGVPWGPGRLDQLRDQERAAVVLPGCEPPVAGGPGLLPLPRRSPYFHPDLVHAADLVVGKLGYSTLAETWTAGVPFAYVARDRFPESVPVSAWVDRQMASARLGRRELDSGDWISRLDELLALPRMPERVGGAPEAAAAIAALMGIGRWIPGPPDGDG